MPKTYRIVGYSNGERFDVDLSDVLHSAACIVDVHDYYAMRCLSEYCLKNRGCVKEVQDNPVRFDESTMFDNKLIHVLFDRVVVEDENGVEMCEIRYIDDKMTKTQLYRWY